MAPSDAGSLGQLTWHVARQCDAGTCVQVAQAGEQVLIRDSKDPGGPVLAYSRAEWTAFVAGVRHGDFDNIA